MSLQIGGALRPSLHSAAAAEAAGGRVGGRGCGANPGSVNTRFISGNRCNLPALLHLPQLGELARHVGFDLCDHFPELGLDVTRLEVRFALQQLPATAPGQHPLGSQELVIESSRQFGDWFQLSVFLHLSHPR